MSQYSLQTSLTSTASVEGILVLSLVNLDTLEEKRVGRVCPELVSEYNLAKAACRKALYPALQEGPP